MILFERLKKTFVFSVFLCLCPLLSFADVSCPSGYVKISESDSIIVTNSSSCPSGHTKLSDVSGNTSVTNCTTGLSSGFCTYYSESCQSGKYFDGTTHKTCIAGSYCDGSGTATPGISGCSKACPENSTSTSGATLCTCNDGYYMVDGVCEICPIGSYCANNIKTACDTGYNTDNTGSTSESQCYTTCEVACTQQTCPDNATCTHGTTTTTGKQYVGGTCDATASQCEITVTCNSGYLLTDGECVQIEFEPEFTITTTKLSADTTFRFTLAAAGTFYINWGDGNIKVIEKTTVAEDVIEHTYADSGTYTIGLAGDATGYNAGINTSSIRFSHDTNSDVNGWKYIAGIDGSLGAIFGTLENPTLTSQPQPRFRYTFSGCTNLTSAIPPELFNGIYGAPVDRMFMGLFNECSKMSGTLPSELFADLSGQITENMFRQSFNSCAGLTGSIPADFFGGLSGELRNSSLYRTFYGCSKLSGYIEPTLFANFTESSTATSQMTGVFTNTGLDTVCPANTYNYDNVFNDYFDGRVSCSPCPDNGLSVSGENSEISACYLDAICSDVGQGTQQCNYNTTTDEYTDCITCIYTSCNSGYELVDGACEMISFEPEFTITTTEIPANTEFTFKISAAGMYYIDWGDGTIEPIEKTNLTNTPYSHKYELKGTYEIKLAGQATGYNSDVNTSAIDFSGNTYIAGIDGSLGAIFGTLENPTFNTKTQPRFRYTFSGCTNLASAIPPELFSGIYGAPTDRMFMAMFSGCSKLSGTLPANLFAGMSGQITENMFRQMFYGCSSLSGPIPSGLFGDLSGQLQTSSFLRTFSGCTSLDGYIPPDLFAKFTRPSTMSGQMTEIFYNTKLDTACPVNMYQYKTGYEEFFNSHVACTPCPDGYSSESGSTSESQCYTACEVACTQQTCPDNATCTHGTTTTTGKQYVGGTCDATASQCELNINCDTGYELKDGTCTAIVCESGYYLDGNECIICPIGSYCANNIKTACDTGYTTDNTGATSESQCYTTCEVACTQQTCPDNATCTHGTTTTTGKQYVGGTCDASASQCELTVNCATGYELTNGTCSAIVCESGYYLDGNECIICPLGSYCANNTKTACDTGYNTDNTGSTSESQCYTTCEVACTQQTCPDNATCTHGTTTTTGKQYVGGTCDATASQCELNIICDKGYDKQSEIELVEQTPLIPVDYHEYGDDYGSISADGGDKYHETEYGLTENNTWASHFDYGTVYGRASCQPSTNAGITYIYNNLESVMGGGMSVDDFESGLSAISGTAKAKYIADVLRGLQDGTKTETDLGNAVFVVFGVEYDANYSTSSTGQNCYCQMTGYTPTDETKQSVVGAPWVFYVDFGSADNCADDCASICAVFLQGVAADYDVYRAAVFSSLGVQSNVMCEIDTIDIPAGYYLPANTTEPVQCPMNNYCPGQTGAIFNTTETQGLKPCPDGYLSESGSTSESQCYTTCEVACTQQTCPDNATCTHGTTTTTGKQYVGGTCDASASQCELNITCDTGYSKKEGEISVVEKTPLIPVDYHEYGDDYGCISADGYIKLGETEYGLTENNTWASHFDYGTVYGRASCQPSMDEEFAYINNNLSGVMGGDMTIEAFESGLAAISGTAKAKYVSNLITELQNGTKSESDLMPALWPVFGTETDANYSTTDTGQYCYCQMTGYAPTDGTKQSVVGAPWVFYGGVGSASDCADFCALDCAYYLLNGDAFYDVIRAAVFSSLGVQSNVMCEIDTIDIPAGYYLPANTTEPVQCPMNNYCPGQTGAIFNITETQGLKPCPDGYSSESGSISESQCYTTCEVACTQQACPENATCTHGTTTTTGKQYVGGTCDATASQCELNIICDKGYDKQSEIELVEQTPLIPVDYTEGGDGYAWSDLSNRWYSSNFKEAGLTKANTWASRFAYGAVYGNASCQPVSVNTESFMYISRNRVAAQNGDMSEEDFEAGLSAISGAEKAGYITKVLRGYKEGTQTQADFYRAIWTMFGTEKNEDFSTTSEGAYCHCQMTDFAPTGQSKQSVTGAWVFSTVYGDDYSCMRLCSQNCSNGLQHDGGLSSDTFRAAIFGFYSIQYETMCTINKVDIPAGYYLPANTTEPVQCPMNNYCPGQTGAIFNITETQGLKPCPDGTTSNVGASSIDQCIGVKTLHIGDEIQMNLTTVKPSTPRVMVFDVLGDLYYGGLSETAKPINKNTDKQFRIYDPESNQNYWMHDYTVQ